MPRPISATIHLSSLEKNLSIAAEVAHESKVWAVVKANTYGHGISRVYPALANADGVAVIDLNEAEHLRALGWRKPILLLEGFFDDSDIPVLDALNLTTVIHCPDQLRMLEVGARSGQLKPGSVDVVLKMNTGMNRLGFTPDAYRSARARLRAVSAVRSITHATHFADADDDKGVKNPLLVFIRAIGDLHGPVSAANSAGILWHSETHREWVRAGIMLYGGSPSGDWKDVSCFGLQPAMTLQSKIIAVQKVKPGQSVGYGSTYTATHAQRIGIVACGYADGYPRMASSHANHYAPVCVGGYATRTVGRVSMDMLTVDLTDCYGAEIGSPVELWGKNVPIDDVAAAAGTIGYELMCALASRVTVNVEN
ncbi:alanine racemase [Cupriavidus sp. CuC1]|uniref:alanine racemase n=1 Tax=Cupriavidus sp. CuC1 TaxID=3373131 RepID=UPI0037D86333